MQCSQRHEPLQTIFQIWGLEGIQPGNANQDVSGFSGFDGTFARA